MAKFPLKIKAKYANGSLGPEILSDHLPHARGVLKQLREQGATGFEIRDVDGQPVSGTEVDV